MSVVDPTGVALRSLVDMGAGDLDSFGAHIHPDAVNREAVEEPPACRGRGPEAFRATARWLRAAFPDLSFDVLDVVSDRGLVVIHATMSGTHRGPFVVYDAAGRVERAVAPTGRRFAVTQTHWYRSTMACA
ncbi:ester cyclase [Gordonia sp. NPDC003504]